MAEAKTTYEIKQAFWHKGHLKTPGTEAKPNTIDLSDREARYHLTSGDIGKPGSSKPSQKSDKAASKAAQTPAPAAGSKSQSKTSAE